LPIGKHPTGLPFGIQVIGKSFSENELFAFSKYLTEEM
jgi:Asp-tRNA(Asn)/Glu-tRNA(Gln) amidotransferase A subunit family amidase